MPIGYAAMSKKRLWDEVDDHTGSNGVSVSYGGPDPPPQDPQPSQQGNKSKRARLAWSEKPLNRSRSSWGRLGAFCSKWFGFLFTTNNYHRKPNVAAGKEIRLEIRHTASVPFTAYCVTTLKDEILIFGRGKEEKDRFINVYDRSNLTEAKAVIPLEAIDAECIEACNVSNCVYVLVAEPEAHIIVRLTKDERQFNISPLIGNLLQSCSCMNVSANGNIIVSFPVEIAVYNSSGSLRHKVVLSTNVFGFKYVENVLQKSNGNLVVQSLNLPFGQDMMELDTTGRTVNRHQSSTSMDFIYSSFVDAYDRTFICFDSRFEVLDPEFKELKFTVARPDKGRPLENIDTWHYDRERHEAIRLSTDDNYQNGVLSIFHLGEQ